MIRLWFEITTQTQNWKITIYYYRSCASVLVWTEPVSTCQPFIYQTQPNQTGTTVLAYLLSCFTFVLATLNSDRLITISIVDTLIIFWYSYWVPTKESSQNVPASDQLLSFCKRHFDWLNFRNWPWYHIKIKNKSAD